MYSRKEAVKVIDLHPFTVIATIVNLIVLFLILRKLLLKPVGEMLEKRRQMVYDDLENAKSSREEAQQLLEEHRQLISGSKGEAVKIIDEAVRQADLRRGELLAKAEQEAAAVVERAKAEIAREQAKAIELMRGEISALSIAVAEKMLARTVTGQDQDRIFDEVLEELEESYAKYSS